MINISPFYCVAHGKQGKMQSMHLFMKEKNSKIGIRTSLENFSVFDKINVIPLATQFIVNITETGILNILPNKLQLCLKNIIFVKHNFTEEIC